MKKCRICGYNLNKSQFNKNPADDSGLNSQCKLCQKMYCILHTYDITEDEYFKLWNLQCNKCAICGVRAEDVCKSLGLDHNKITGKTRGLLCFNCNAALGKLMTDLGTKLLEKAIDYINNPPFNLIRPD